MNPNPAQPKSERERNERQDWVVVLLILLIGLCCVAGAGQYALRFVPNWQLDADMGSNIDLNSEFLTSRPIAYFEPVDPAILTQPAWVNGNVFLTPGTGNSIVKNSTPLPTSNASTSVPTVMGTTAVPTIPGVVTNTVVPTNTLVWIPIPATRTSRPNPGATATNTSPPPGPPSADLRITITDGTGIYVPGGTLTYTIVVSNTGPSNVTGATVTDNFPLQVSNITGSCAVAGGAVCGWSGSGNINDTVNLPVGSSITYTITVTINPGATGGLVNTASVGIPAGYTESNSANNSVTDTNTFSGNANLQITKSDGTGTYIPGGTLTYTIVVSNTGPSSVTGATVTDAFPGQITGASWTCAITAGASCTASGSGNINDSAVNLPVGRSVTYTVNVSIGAGASGNLSNTASVSLPAGYTGPSPVSATDTDTAAPIANLQITKSDGTGTYVPGGTLTYTIVVSNSGPSNVIGATVTDTFPFPGQISGFGAGGGCAVAGGATCTWGGSGNINDTVNLPVGSSITYTVPVNISAGAAGNLSNTASVSLPAGYTGPSPVSAMDTDTASPTANLQITKSDGVAIYVPGGTLTYTIVVSNSGPSNVTGAVVTDNFPAQISGFGAGGGCAVAGGATCTWGGSGNINDTVNLPVGSSITYTVPVNISAGASGNLINTASVSLPAGYAGTSPVSATDTDAPSGPLTANLWITKTDNATHYVAGGSTTYYVTIGNSGPSPVNGVIVSDTLPGQISAATWTCAGTPGASCTASGSGNINDSSVNLPVGSSVTYTIVASINGGVSGNLVNTAYASLPVGYAGASPVSAMDTDTQITVDPIPGGMATYDGSTTELSAPTTLTLALGTNVIVDGNGDWDLVYYERNYAGGIRMDWVQLQIGDGHNWYTILNWGNGSSDTNTNIALPVGGACPTETDNCIIPGSALYNNTGVLINVDGAPSAPPNGTYSYIRIIVPAGGNDSTCGIDAIVPYP